MFRRKPPRRFVLDTSIFINPDAQKHFGTNSREAIDNFLKTAKAHKLEIYMPASIFRELGHFVEENILKGFKRNAVIRGPDLHNTQVPAAIFHSFIHDLRGRINQGLRIAEKAIKSENIPDNIRRIREHYRGALRTGIIDSVEDLDVVLMAKEVGGSIISADEGIAKMAESLGIETLSAEDFAGRYPKKGDS